MTDTTSATPKAKREMIADRQWIDATGQETKDETKATGFRYVLLGEGTDKAAKVASGKAFKYSFPTASAGNPETMLAIFGGLTKAGNIVNTWNHEKTEERAAGPIEAISDWFSMLDSGKWGEERSGGGIARFDSSALAKALASVTGKPEAEFAAKLAAGAPKITINAQNKQDPSGKRQVLYGTYALYNTKVKEAYNALVGASEPSTDDL